VKEPRSQSDPAPDWESLARAAAQPPPAEPPPARQELLVFELEGVPYALLVECVREIVRLRPITPVPRVAPEICGVISLRGEIVLVIDARRRLQLPQTAPTRASRIVVVQDGEGRQAGVLVDAVRAVLRVREDAFCAATPGEPGAVAALCRSGEHFVSVIDLERLVDGDADA
jgi:purine-binding chemotaxis protein CheW